jgi:hypothetical protein
VAFSSSAGLIKGEGQNRQDFQPMQYRLRHFFPIPLTFSQLFPSYLPTPSHTMAPSLEESTQIDFEAPLKAAPKLVAPEPGMQHPLPPFLQSSYATLTLSLQSTVPDPSLSKPVKATRAPGARTSKSAPRRPKGRTRTSRSSRRGWRA